MKTTTRKIALALLAGAALCACGPSTTPRPADAAFLASPDPALRALPFSEAVRAGDFLYLAGQIGNAPGLVEPVPGGIKAEARQVMENIKGVLARHGASMDHVVKCTVFLTDMSEWPAFNDTYRGYFPKHFPARSALGANGLAKGARVEVECIAFSPKTPPETGPQPSFSGDAAGDTLSQEK
jgi:reactive intermediate/imine deaminase